MADPLAKVTCGSPLDIPAEAYNAFVDAAKDFRSRAGGGITGDTGTAGRNPGMVRVYNDTGADLVAFSVVGLEGMQGAEWHNASDALGQAAILTAKTPENRFEGFYGITTQPIPSTGIGWAVAAGVVPVIVDIQDEAHAYAKLHDRTAGTMISCAERGAAQILAQPAGTGDRFCLVKIGSDAPATPTWGKVIDDWETGDATVEVHPCDADGTNVDLDTAHTLYFYLPTAREVLPSHPDIKAGDYIAYWTTADGTRFLCNCKDEQRAEVYLGTVVANSADSPYFQVNALTGPDAGSQVTVYVNWQNGISQNDKFGALGTNARTGQVIAFEYVKFPASFNRTPDYYCQCLTDVRDDLIGTIKMMKFSPNGTAMMPYPLAAGWQEYGDLGHKFPRGATGSGDDATGGAATHTHPDHGPHSHYVDMSGQGSVGGGSTAFTVHKESATQTQPITHDAGDHTPEFVTIRFIVRTD